MTKVETALLLFNIVSDLGFFVYLKWGKPNLKNIKNLVSNSTDNNYPELGISYEEFEIKETEEEYLSRLCTLYKDAYKEYKSKTTELDSQTDRYINLSVLKIRTKEMQVELNHYTMDFSDGTQIWVQNKWYGFGKIYRCTTHSNFINFNHIHNTIGCYAFMSLVDLYYEKIDEQSWKQNHDEYTRKKLGK